MDIEQVARVCHEANRAYCQSLGDNSQPGWDEAPQWQRDSCINGVQFKVDNPYAGPGASHESWMAEKRAAGWRKGNRKDPHAKIHPCLVPFAELPLSQQIKDYIFTAIVEAFQYAERPEGEVCYSGLQSGPTEEEVAEKIAAMNAAPQTYVGPVPTLAEGEVGVQGIELSEDSDGTGIGDESGAADRGGETATDVAEGTQPERIKTGGKTRRRR